MTTAREQLDRPVRVVGICGSLTPRGRTHVALATALAGAEAIGADCELIDLRDYDLIFCTGGPQPDDPPGVLRLRRKVREAEGIILATPEYHGSFSGVLKNALDLMGFSEFEGKMIGLVGIAGGALGAVNALTTLRMIGRALHAWVVPEQVAIPHAWQAIDDDGRFTDPQLEKQVRQVGEQVAKFAYLHSAEAAREFLRAWEEAPRNPGGA